MSLYNMLFGMNAQTDILLAVIGLRSHEIERLRNVFAGDDGKTIQVYTRTGGGNRDDYPNEKMRSVAAFVSSEDDDFDSTYCTDTFSVPSEFWQDVVNLGNVFTHGIRPEFAQHIAKTLNREPTDDDKIAASGAEETRTLMSCPHILANG